MPDFSFSIKLYQTQNVPSMAKQKIKNLSKFFNKFSTAVTRAVGRPLATIIAFTLIVVWGITGPIFDYSDTWQLFINTGTTIITFLMVFIIQQSQNKDTIAIHLKLNELLACNEKASNRLVDVEDLTEEEFLTEEELTMLKRFYIKLSDLAEKDKELFTSHSIDEADVYHQKKLRTPKGPKAEG
jgi:low affinity Fe/Cu permease